MTNPVETQGTIHTWADSVLGPGAPQSIARRLTEEFGELMEALAADPLAKLASTHEEAADVGILLMRFASVSGFHLPAKINEKMAVNRKRKWVSSGDGTGQHVAIE